MKRTVYFRVPVEFDAESEAGLEHAIKSYTGDSESDVSGFNVEHGCYGYVVGQPERTPLDRSRAALPENVRKVLEESNLPVEVATAIADALEFARPAVIEECAQAAEHVVPRHTECGNRIAAAIRALKGLESGDQQ